MNNYFLLGSVWERTKKKSEKDTHMDLMKAGFYQQAAAIFKQCFVILASVEQ